MRATLDAKKPLVAELGDMLVEHNQCLFRSFLLGPSNRPSNQLGAHRHLRLSSDMRNTYSVPRNTAFSGV